MSRARIPSGAIVTILVVVVWVSLEIWRLFLAPAHAAELAYLPNQAGGQIVLTDVKPDACSGRAIAFARTSDGNTLYGCWTPGERFITIEWSDGDFRTYPIADFELYRAPDDRPLRGI